MEGSSRRLLSHVSAQPYLPTRVHELRVTYLFAKYVRGGEEESVGCYRIDAQEEQDSVHVNRVAENQET